MILSQYQSLEVGEVKETIEPATHHKYGVKISICHTLLIAGAFIFLLFFAGYVSNSLVAVKSECLGPPYLYISHQDSQNILKYTRDGCPVSQNVLWFGRPVDPIPESIRSMAIHPYGSVKNALFITNAGKNGIDSGRVLVFDTCTGLSGSHTFLKTLVDVRNVHGARHSYSLTFDGRGYMYVSFQTTDVVLRFSDTTFQPISLNAIGWFDDLYTKDLGYSQYPPIGSKRNYTAEASYYPGTFVQVIYFHIHFIFFPTFFVHLCTHLLLHLSYFLTFLRFLVNCFDLLPCCLLMTNVLYSCFHL